MNAAIHMALSRKIEYDAYTRSNGGPHLIGFGDVAFYEPVARIAGHIRQVRQIACVGQSVKIKDSKFWVRLQQIANEIAADEPAAACHEHSCHASILRR